MRNYPELYFSNAGTGGSWPQEEEVKHPLVTGRAGAGVQIRPISGG